MTRKILIPDHLFGQRVTVSAEIASTWDTTRSGGLLPRNHGRADSGVVHRALLRVPHPPGSDTYYEIESTVPSDLWPVRPGDEVTLTFTVSTCLTYRGPRPGALMPVTPETVARRERNRYAHRNYDRDL